MPLTDLQAERVAFHLDYVTRDYLAQIGRDDLTLALNESQRLGLVGPEDLSMLPQDEVVSLEGVDLATKTSMLGKVEMAFANLTPTIIDDSLYVSVAGSVTLRGSEVMKREQLYKTLVRYMAQLIGGTVDRRVGW